MPKIPQILSLVLVLAAMSVSVEAQVPQLINYQGRMTDTGGNPVDTVVAVYFTIYDHESDPTAKMWEEGHDGVTVTNGLFNVMIGSYETIPNDLFSNDTALWLGITIGDGPESEPLIRMVTVPWAYHALRADTADVALSGASGDGGWTLTGNVVHLTDESDTVRVGGFSGGARVNISDEAGADVDSSTGLGVWTHNSNASKTTAGYFSAEGTRGPATGIRAIGLAETADTVYGLTSFSTNTGSGPAIGIYGETEFAGEGDKIGVRGRGAGAGAGDNYGGHFSTAGGMSNTGTKYGVYGYGHNLTMSDAYGVYGEAYNPNDGTVYGGCFTSGGTGSAVRYGVSGSAHSDNAADAIGVSGTGSNYGSGNVYGGRFSALGQGTGEKRGIYASATSSGNQDAYSLDMVTVGYGSGITYGVHSLTQNTHGGQVYGGHFEVTASSTDWSYGLVVDTDCDDAGEIVGISASATNTSTGVAYGGVCNATSNSQAYAVIGTGKGINADYTRGVWGSAENLGSGPAEAGYFSASNNGTGTHYGVYAYELAGGSGAAVYASGDMVASGAKPAVVRTSKGATLMYAMESAEVWFEDFGEGQLTDGKAHIDLDALFMETVTIDDAHPMKVFIQLNDDCNGTYVKTAITGFDVYEQQHGTSDASFTYRVVAKRKGYEDERMRATDIGHDDPHLYPERAEEIYEKMGFKR